MPRNPGSDFYRPAEPKPAMPLQFVSPERGLYASNIITKVTTPAWDGTRHNGGFQRAVDSALQRARQAGQAHPIIMGAIPFDTRQPSCLYVPGDYQWRRPEPPPPQEAQRQPPSLREARHLPREGAFKQAVRQAIANFQHSDIRKVVLSRILELHLSEAVDIDQLLTRLRHQNPEGYQFRVPMEDGATLVGVSPELLLRKDGDTLLSNPLAGTARRQTHGARDRAAARDLMASAKDRYEHRLVVDQIRRVLAPRCAHLEIPESPSLIATSALWHLSTAVEGRVGEPDATALQLACGLHPTPAVCGYPTDPARKLIHLVEPFERGLFTGMVGWCDLEGNGEWAVTIRCGSVRHDRVRLFAGAGIVEASQPEAEWAETQAKLATMLNAFGLDAAQLDICSRSDRPAGEMMS